jgi:hypothetical protein
MVDQKDQFRLEPGISQIFTDELIQTSRTASHPKQ